MTQYQYTGEDSAAIKADIERTRTNMSHKIDAIQERFQPEHLKQQTQDVVRSAMQDGTEAVVDYLRDHAQDFSGSLMDTIKRNPVPSALIGLGLGMILYENFNQSSKGNGYRYPRYSERYDSGYEEGNDRRAYSGSDPSFRGDTQRYYATSSAPLNSDEEGGLGERMRGRMEDVRAGVSDAAERVSDQLQEVGEQIGDQIGGFGSEGKHRVARAGKQVQQVAEANPLGMGLAALAVGAALGLALPSTRRENRMMGEWRDQMMDKAKHKASDVAHRVQEVVEEVKPELNEIAHRVIDDVAETGKSAVSEVKESVQRVTSE